MNIYLVMNKANKSLWHRLSKTQKAIVGWLGNSLGAKSPDSAVSFEDLLNDLQVTLRDLRTEDKDIIATFKTISNPAILRRELRQLFEAEVIAVVSDP